jgi:hypothetical protein
MEISIVETKTTETKATQISKSEKERRYKSKPEKLIRQREILV